MPRLLMVATVAATLEAFLIPFALHFRNKGWRVDCLAQGVSSSELCHKSFDQTFEIRWSRNPFDPRNLLEAPERIRTLVAREEYDLVHVHTPVAAFVTRYALRKNGPQPKVIYTAHGFHFYQGAPWYKNAIFRLLEQLAGRWTDYLVVINQEDEEAARRYSIVPEERLWYMPGIGIDTQYYSPDRVPADLVAKVRSELGLRENDKMFLMIAEFIPRKRHRDIISAFARLDEPMAHLVLAGAGPEMKPMKDFVHSLGVEKRVHFLGHRRDIPTLIRAATATVLPSEQEGLPRSVMESHSLGVPVIATNIRGIRDLIKPGSGYLVEVGDIEGLTRAMARVLEAPEEARAAGLAARERIAPYDIRRILAEHEALYAHALDLTDPVRTSSSK